MNVGRFREQISLYRRNPSADTKDAYGRTIRHYAFAEQVKAGARDVSSKDFFEAAAHKLQDTVTFDTRWKSDLDATWRLLWHGDAYEIVQVNHLGYRGDFLRIQARKIEPDGSVVYEGASG